MLQMLRNWFGGTQQKTTPPSHPLPPPEPELVVPEVTVATVQEQLQSDRSPLLLDVREPWEWRQVHIPTTLHIPMNDIPAQLTALPQERTIVVICAHGSRSYGVAGYLIEQGFQASSLQGGITEWVRNGGDYRQGAEKGEVNE
ncbi:MAG TPA: rhodanese-like domain-containing protein [Caldilineaceae bacterium]|nr:rhodanese-like domain-containing protein [Caldilineaceae bacterium]